MKIKKLKFDGMDSFNDYSVELSYGQLVAIRNSLEKDHAEPISDELYAELNYYLQNIPGPGENSEEFKAQRDAATKPKDQAGVEVGPDDVADQPQTDTEVEGNLPPPPSGDDEGGDGHIGAPGGEGDLEGAGGPPPEGGPGGAPGGPGGGGPAGFKEGPKLSPEERAIIDRGMPTGGQGPAKNARGPLGKAKAALLPAPPAY